MGRGGRAGDSVRVAPSKTAAIVAQAQAATTRSKKAMTHFASSSSSSSSPPLLDLPFDTIERSRANEYRPVLKTGSLWRPLAYVSSLLAAVSFLATPYGAVFLALSLQSCTGFFALGTDLSEAARAAPWRTGILATLVTSFWSVGLFLPFARTFDAWYAQQPALRNQNSRSHSVQGLDRSEVRLAVWNLIIAAALTAAVAITHVTHGYDLIYDNVSDMGAGWKGWAYLLASTAAYFIWVDAWAYVSHRALHLPLLYRRFHKWHHAHRQPTAFSALALHPFDMIFFQGGVYTGLYLMPLHPAAIAVNLLYIHYFNVVDHSGVFSESWFPWQPSSLYHDAHHKLFHVNYGQTLTIFDRLGGTFYRPNKRYTESSFSY